MSRWADAQKAEWVYHLAEVDGWPSVQERRIESARLQRWYAGMLNIPLGTATGEGRISVTDFGCGPDGLLLRSPVWGQATAIDPLTFSPSDEAAYQAAGITRIVGTAEDYAGPQTDEAWVYNCLQHVRDWSKALNVACKTASKTLRIFEWVGVPTDAVHIHTLRTDALRLVLATAGLREVQWVTGRASKVGTWEQSFYAGIWER